MTAGASRDDDVEGGAWDVVIAPLHHQDVVASLLQQVAYVVLQVAQMFDENLLAGDLRTVHTHQEHVLTWDEKGEDKRSHCLYFNSCIKDTATSSFTVHEESKKMIRQEVNRRLTEALNCWWF